METLFSTPADLNALLDLLQHYPYPQYQVYVRKNHGFFLLAQDYDDAMNIFGRYRLGIGTAAAAAASSPEELGATAAQR
jgi:hypothetical protein